MVNNDYNGGWEDTHEYFTAEDAKKIYMNSIDSQVNEIIKLIKVAAIADNSLTIYKSINQNIKDELCNRGFNIKSYSGSQRDEPSTKISW